jgi:hypothetical protein
MDLGRNKHARRRPVNSIELGRANVDQNTPSAAKSSISRFVIPKSSP